MNFFTEISDATAEQISGGHCDNGTLPGGDNTPAYEKGITTGSPLTDSHLSGFGALHNSNAATGGENVLKHNPFCNGTKTKS